MRKFKRIAAYFVAALFLAIIGSALLSLSARSAELENEVSIRHALPGGRHYKALVYKTLNDLQYWLRRYPVRGEWIVILIPDEDDRRITIVDVRMLSETGDQIVFHEQLRLKGNPADAASKAVEKIKQTIKQKIRLASPPPDSLTQESAPGSVRRALFFFCS